MRQGVHETLLVKDAVTLESDAAFAVAESSCANRARRLVSIEHGSRNVRSMSLLTLERRLASAQWILATATDGLRKIAFTRAFALALTLRHLSPSERPSASNSPPLDM